MRTVTIAATGLCLILAGCMQTPDQTPDQTAQSSHPPAPAPMQPGQPQSQMMAPATTAPGYAGRPYAQVAAAANVQTGTAGMSASPLGPMIGATLLANGTLIYRHLSPAEAGSMQTSYADPAKGMVAATEHRLTYFLVGQDGMIRDFATGMAPSQAAACFGLAPSGASACVYSNQKQAALAMFDATVRTGSGQPIGVWGPREQVETDFGTN